MVQNKTDPAGRPRGRPRKYDPDTALAAARDIFWLKGYAGTSLDDLANATGMNRPSLYAAFGDKEQLYLASLRYQAGFMTSGVEAIAAVECDALAFVTTLFDRATDLYLSGPQNARGCYMTGTALTQAYVSEDVQKFVRETFERIEHTIETRLRSAVASGQLQQDTDPRACALLISSTLHELSILARTGADRSALEERSRLAIKLMRL